jgi:hypothetical protein
MHVAGLTGRGNGDRGLISGNPSDECAAGRGRLRTLPYPAAAYRHGFPRFPVSGTGDVIFLRHKLDESRSSSSKSTRPHCAGSHQWQRKGSRLLLPSLVSGPYSGVSQGIIVRRSQYRPCRHRRKQTTHRRNRGGDARTGKAANRGLPNSAAHCPACPGPCSTSWSASNT